MTRPKRGSPTLEKALRRISGMRSISPTLNFGNGLNLTDYDNRIQTLQNELSRYNTVLSTLDEMAGRISQIEDELSRYSEKMLMSVVTHYGKDSLQYVQAGGKQRKSSSRRSSNSQSPSESTATTLNDANKNGKKSSAVLP
jgi:DNA primase